MQPKTVVDILTDIAGAFGGSWAARATTWNQHLAAVTDDVGRQAAHDWIRQQKAGPSLSAFLAACQEIARRTTSPGAGRPDCVECSGRRFHRVRVELTDRGPHEARYATAYEPCRCSPADYLPQRLAYRVLERIPEPYYPGSPEAIACEAARAPAPTPEWKRAATVPATPRPRHHDEGEI